MRISIGLTLLEILVALAVAALLLTVAVAAFSSLAHGVRLSVLTNDFLSDLALTRVEAIKRGRRVALCKSYSGVACTRAGDWSQGRIIFADTNNNGTREPSEPLLSHKPKLPAGWRIVGNSPVANYVSYHPLGRTLLVSGAFQAGTLTVCRRASLGTGQARQIVINSTGRVRSQVAQSVPPACV